MSGLCSSLSASAAPNGVLTTLTVLVAALTQAKVSHWASMRVT